MKALNIEETQITPKITLDHKSSVFEISGRSLTENPTAVYTPVVQWLAGYAKEPNNITLFVFKFEYFNTATSKAVLDILTALSYIKNIKVLWYYHEEDEDMKVAGEEFFELINIPFEFKTY